MAYYSSEFKKMIPVFQQYGVYAAYLFGSRADGTAYTNSDYDIACLLENNQLAKKPLIAPEIALELEETLDKSKIDVILLNNAPLILCYEIIAHGKVIYCKDDDRRTTFEDRVMRDYLDFKPFIAQYDKEVEEAIRGGNFFA